jgi:hypothetical protein
VISYNQAACYWNLKMLEECADHLDKAVESLNNKVKALEDAENNEFVKASDSTRSSIAK